MHLQISSDYIGVIRKLSTDSKVIIMSSASHPIFGKFLDLKVSRTKSLQFIKVDAHQDDVKSCDQPRFLEQLNVKFDARVKQLILKTSEDEVITFHLDLQFAHVTNSETH